MTWICSWEILLMKKSLLILILGVGVLLGTVGVSGHNQEINTRLVAPWSPTAPLHEAAEFLGDVNPALYWTYVDSVVERLEKAPRPATVQAERDLALVVAYPLISSSKLRMLDWSLSARTYSPKVLSLQQLAPDHVPSECSDAFVVVGVGHKTSCNLQEVEKLLENAGQEAKETLLTPPIVTEFDHKYPSMVWTQTKGEEVPPLPVAILYGNIKSSQTKELHQLLKKWSDRVGYILRPYEDRSGNKTDEKMLLSGYGIELQFKSTEYKAQDDSGQGQGAREVSGFEFDKLQEIYPEKAEQLDKFQNYLVAQKGAKKGFEALKAWQVQELGLQAAYFTTEKENMIEALKDVSGNFPSRAAALSSVRVPADFKRSVAYNQRLIQSHFNLDEGEGAFFLQGSYEDPDSLDLFTFMQKIQGELEFMELLRSLRQDTPQITRSDVEKILALGTKSQSEPDLALDMRDSSIFWINDLEKDEEYEDWPDDLTQLFFRMGGIMLRPVRRNVFNLVIAVDPPGPDAGALLKMAYSFMTHKSPVRIGVVFCSPNTESEAPILIRRIMNYAASEGKTRPIFHDVVNALSTNEISKLEKKWGSLATEDLDFGAELACDFVRRSGRETPSAFLNGVPLKWDSLDDFEDVVLNQLLREAQVIQMEAYNRKVNEDTDIFDYIMNKPHVLTRLNDRVLDTSTSKTLSFGTESWSDLGKHFRDPLANIANSLTYLNPTGKKTVPATVSIWAFADLETPEGREFLSNAVEFMDESSSHARLSFISSADKLTSLTKDVLEAIRSSDVKAIKKLLKSESYQPGSGDEDNVAGRELMKQLGLSGGDRGILVNGRLIGPLSPTESFGLGDWALVQKFSYDSCPKHLEGEEDWTSDGVMRLCSALSSPIFKKSSRRYILPEFQNPQPVGKERETGKDVFYVDLVAIVDPASRHAHKMAALIAAVEQKVGEWVQSRVIFNPPTKHSELPLKSYYRYVAGADPDETIAFKDLPREPLFTQNIFAPDNWMVQVVACEKDLDNIRLRDLGDESVESVYELEHLLVEGHCLESKSGSPPRGLQFILTPHNPNLNIRDTLVMANLGYFQLKASPGIWTLDLREGASREIFSLESGKPRQVVVNSFQQVILKQVVRRNPGKETASLLDAEEENSSSWFGFGNKPKENEEDTINVFSVASGHLYERLLRIMMLSVMKNTESKVKFWFLKNYLSPSVKDILPEMAKEYGFEYELVQYHWPRWLNPQREKQRIIWGYKILFLDVLFPLNVKKIVFVDADQIVRADLKELFELDLEGNPYGYTPFCDSRTEMEGFRFWKQGYWRSHLGRRKYHISALYVVDLLRFRRVAAGDRLRGQYQALSQDPNSLSNLDQDLPNNMIHQVGIKSLPQEWLWCETWCDDASKPYAKTIDLCNNPETKEPKLDAAQRIVPEWKDYDLEIRQLIRNVKERREREEAEDTNQQIHVDHSEL